MKLKKVVKTEWRCPNCDVVIELPQASRLKKGKKGIKKRARWTAHDDRTLLRLARLGKTAKTIGKMLGRTDKSIRCRLTRLRREMGITERKCKRWNEAEDKVLITMREKGKKFREIARKLGRSTDAACGRYLRIKGR